MLSGEAANSNFSLLFEPMLLHHRCGQLTQWFQSRLKCKLTKEENKGSKMITTRSFASGDHNRNDIFTKDEIITVKSRKINFLHLLNLKVTSISKRSSWSYGSWINNCHYNRCDHNKLRVRTQFIARCTGYNIM